MNRKPLRIVLIGAASVVFTRRLLSDLLSWSAIREATLALHDIDPGRLETAAPTRWPADWPDLSIPVIEATLDLEQVWQMTDELIEAESRWLPDWLAATPSTRSEVT